MFVFCAVRVVDGGGGHSFLLEYRSCQKPTQAVAFEFPKPHGAGAEVLEPRLNKKSRDAQSGRKNRNVVVVVSLVQVCSENWVVMVVWWRDLHLVPHLAGR